MNNSPYIAQSPSYPLLTDADGVPWRSDNIPEGTMVPVPLFVDEEDRLATLRSYEILDTEHQDDVFDSLTAMVNRCMGTDICLISFVDKDRLWFKSMAGTTCTGLHRNNAFCAWACLSDAQPEPKVLVVEDTKMDRRFAFNDLVMHPPNVRFYAGMPLVAPNGHRLGTFCVLDSKPRLLSAEDQSLLKSMSELVMRELDSRRVQPLTLDLKDIPTSMNLRKTLQRVSHNMRTPLHAIAGALELLSVTDEEQAPLVETMKKGVAELMDNVDTMLEGAVLTHPIITLPEPSEVSTVISPSSSRKDHTPLFCLSPAVSESGCRVESIEDLRVLIVDDCRTNLMILERMLKRLDVKAVDQRVNGRECVDACSGTEYDVVFLDLQMPVMGGTQAASLLKKMARVPFLVAISADYTDGVQERCASAGFNMYMPKPCSLKCIETALTDGLNQGPGSGPGLDWPSNE